MIVDASILVCLLREEPETPRFLPILLGQYGNLKMASANYLEAAIVIDANDDSVLSERLDQLVAHFGIEVVPVTQEQARIARAAYRRFGKGRHPAALNFGDCFAYALARERGEPLLFKGDDFAHTDVTPALEPQLRRAPDAGRAVRSATGRTCGNRSPATIADR